LTDAELIAPGRADAPPDLELRLSGVFGATGRYAFRHALIQEAAYASLPKARAAALHERFALVLQRERPGNPSPAVAAWHLARAAALRAELRPRPT
jgi:predicted ATPase